MDPLQTINVGAAANDGTGDPLRDAFVKVNENFGVIALNDTQGTTTLTGNKVWDGGLTKDVEFNDIRTLSLDATTLNLSGVTGVSVASTGAGLGQGQVEIRADQQFRILTPAVVAQTATAGQTLQLVDAINGIVEFGNSGGGGSYLPLAGGTMSGTINMGSQKITSLGTPTANADGSTKLYVDQRDDIWESVNYAAGATTSVNNMNIGSTTANRVVVSASVAVGGFFTITGIVAPSISGKLLVVNNGTSVPIQMSSLDAASNSANQILCPGDASASSVSGRSLAPGESAVLWYSSSKWNMVDVIRPGNHEFKLTTSGGISVDATFCLRPGGPFEFVAAAAFNFFAIPAISTSTATQVVELFNKSGAGITIFNDSAPGGSTPTIWGILTPSGSNVTWPNLTACRFAYDRASSRWRLLNTPQ